MGSIAVIGSGVAGLASAALAANKGYDVSVFEAIRVGGTGEIRKEGFRFDRGASLLRCLRCLMKFLYHVAKILRTIIAIPDFLSLQNIFIRMAKSFMPTRKPKILPKSLNGSSENEVIMS